MLKYDLSGTPYLDRPPEKNSQYINLIRKAERINRERGGAVSKEEGETYLEAARVCQEIRDENLSQRAVYTKWEMRRLECEERAEEIADIIAPVPPVPPAPSAEPMPAPEEAAPPAQKEPVKATSKPRKASAPVKAAEMTQTASGFTTKNAVKDVSAETIEKWYKPQPNHGFDDVVGMDALKERLINEAASIGWTRTDAVLQIAPLQSYLLYGPPGTGKTFIIEAFARELMEKHGFKFIQLNGGDIHASLVGVAEKTVNIAFQEAIDNAPCIFFIDEIEGVCVGRTQKAEGHEKRLTVAFLEGYGRLSASGKRVVFMGATNHPGQIDVAWMDRMKAKIRIPLPDEDSKEAYFARKCASLTLEDGFTFRDMAEATDNYSYRDLDSLWSTITAQMKQQAIETCRVYAADGTVDQEQTDIAASEALTTGKVRLSRALFHDTQKELSPSDKTEIRQELEEFERSVRAGGGVQ
ncbi:MAG: AAA family ATPase [Clostridiales bacterium]|nr:AAA family ATPase [Clostridiales bacterium]